MAIFQSTGDKRYLDQCLAWGEDTDWKIPKAEANIYGSSFYSLVCGQIWMECYFEKKEPKMVESSIGYLNDSSIRNPVSDPLKW